MVDNVMNKYCTIEIAFGSINEAKKAGEELLNRKLVSSVQMIKSDSSWNWKGERESLGEVLVFVKTKTSLLREIYDYIKSVHSYDCFEFAVFEMQSINKDYLNWIDNETK